MPLPFPAQIESERLLLRAVQEADLPALLLVNGHEEVTRYLPYSTWRMPADAAAWFERIQKMHAAGTGWQLVIIEKQSSVVLGSCLVFNHVPTSARADIGYVLARPSWGQGYMREALRALITCAFTQMSLRRLEAEVDTRNAASDRLLLELGFTKEGLLRQRHVAKAEVKDVYIYGLLSHEWPSGGTR